MSKRKPHEAKMSPIERAENLLIRAQKDRFWNFHDTPNPKTGALRTAEELHEFLDHIDDPESIPETASLTPDASLVRRLAENHA